MLLVFNVTLTKLIFDILEHNETIRELELSKALSLDVKLKVSATKTAVIIYLSRYCISVKTTF